MSRHTKRVSLQHSLLILPGFLIVLSVVFFPLSQGSIRADLPEVILPLGVSLGIALYSVRLLQTDYDVDRLTCIAMSGWAGVVVATVGIWVLVQQLQRELAVAPLFDEVLTVVSLGSGMGVLLGAHLVYEFRSEDRPDRARVLAETVWIDESPPNPILTATTTQMAGLEGVEPLELEPLSEHVDPDVFTDLQAQDNSRWQILFYTDDYEVRVSGQGTVTIYDIASPDERADIVPPLESQW